MGSVDNIKMKLDLSLAAIISTHTVELCQNGVKENCFLSELTEPDHFAKWDCSAPVTLGTVPNEAKCALVCEKGYIPVPLQLRTVHQCGTYGWDNPDSFDMVCEYSANQLQKDILQYWKEHQGFNAVLLIEDPHLRNVTFDDDTVSGVYYFSINGVYGFLCDSPHTIDQNAANLLCESMGYSRAKTGNGTGWFNRDPEWHADVPINLAHVDCTDATSITNCTSGGWGRGLGEDPNGCHYPNATWLSCEK